MSTTVTLASRLEEDFAALLESEVRCMAREMRLRAGEYGKRRKKGTTVSTRISSEFEDLIRQLAREEKVNFWSAGHMLATDIEQALQSKERRKQPEVRFCRRLTGFYFIGTRF